MTRPPLMILCHGSGDAWTARVLKVGNGLGKWRRPDEGDGREATAATARDAVLKAITLQGKEPRVCRRCARTWECKRTRAITICPKCQTGKAAATATPRGHNNLTPEQMEKVRKFLDGCGPYQSDVWSNSYYSEILEHIERHHRKVS